MGDPARYRVTGGRDPEHVAVIAAVLEQILAEEAAAGVATRPEPEPASGWAQSLRPRAGHAPLPGHVYEALAGWGVPGDEGDHIGS